MLINGKQIAEEILDGLSKRPAPKRCLAAVWVGANEASRSFLRQKEKAAEKCGVVFHLFRFPETITTTALQAELQGIAADENCGGIILQLPLPGTINRDEVITSIPPEKDVDALTGKNNLLPPAVCVIKQIFKKHPVPLAEQRAVIVGKGFLTGAPVAKWFEGKAKNLVVVDKGEDFVPLKDADIVISGTGVPGLIRPDMLKTAVVGIDFGYGMKNGKVMGDFDPACEGVCLVFTPTPGGTGPVLVAELFTNFYTLCDAHGRT